MARISIAAALLLPVSLFANGPGCAGDSRTATVNQRT